MTTKTLIEWADLTRNPIVGCSKVSPGCLNCYAERMAAKWAKHPNAKIRAKYAGVVDENGPSARPAHPDWFRGLRDQCVAAGVPFFFKGLGEWDSVDRRNGESCLHLAAPISDGSWPDHHEWPDSVCSYRVGKRRSGRLLDGREWMEVPS